MATKLESKASSATLVDPPVTRTYRYARPPRSRQNSTTSAPASSSDIPDVPPLPKRADGHIISHSHDAIEQGGKERVAVQTPHSPFSPSFNPNAPTPGQVSTLPTPPSLQSHAAPTQAVISLPSTSFQTASSQPQPSPFSASFDPNVGHSHSASYDITQQALRSRLSSSSLASSASIQVAQEQWNHIMSTSLNALANQFQTASRVIGSQASASVHSDGTFGSQHLRDESDASYRTSESGDGAEVAGEDAISELALARTSLNAPNVETMLSLMMSRLENVERNQVRLGGEIERVRQELQVLKTQGPMSSGVTPVERDGYFGSQPSEKAKMKAKEIEVEGESEEDWQKRVTELEAKVESVRESMKIEQARLYPRLRNAFVTLNKQPIQPLPIQGTGKAPANFPATKGEFEHLTKERYEHLMKSYGIPITGDTAAKRQAVREFIALTPPGK